MEIAVYFAIGVLLALTSLVAAPRVRNLYSTFNKRVSGVDLVDLSFSKDIIEWIGQENFLACWIENSSGKILWRSPSLLRMLGGRQSVKDVYEFSHTPQKDKPARTFMKRIKSNRDTPKWYEVVQKTSGEKTLFLAIEATETDEANVLLSEFVQTLTNTFALLSTGLAIFDKNRNLMMFNPALCTLTNLDPVWLSRKPTLSTILDKMREEQTLGEPKDFKSWRESLPNLVQQATDGTYEEIWNMASGQMYRVIGRPHPRGAIALLFEDITSEISAGRRHRMEVELSHNALDASDEAICVFSQDGTMLIANKHFVRMWGMDPTIDLQEISIIDATKTWSSACKASPIWGDTREYVTTTQNRAIWTGDVRRHNNDPLTIRYVPMPNGATLIGFSPVDL